MRTNQNIGKLKVSIPFDYSTTDAPFHTLALPVYGQVPDTPLPGQ